MAEGKNPCLVPQDALGKLQRDIETFFAASTRAPSSAPSVCTSHDTGSEASLAPSTSSVLTIQTERLEARGGISQ